MEHREGELTFEQTRSVESRCRIHPDIVRGAGDRFKLELADGLSVTLPMQLARELLRPLVSEAGLNRVQEALREDSALSGDVWLKRLKQVHAKLIGGDPLHLAEIVRRR